ncbi:G protein-activated inward rectifier potassium channel 3 isoform X2 [Folsomia candida]|nr:G protein-activated inward rectifier potassium channel 3 isoform X2 [Folsomia candida]
MIKSSLASPSPPPSPRTPTTGGGKRLAFSPSTSTPSDDQVPIATTTTHQGVSRFQSVALRGGDTITSMDSMSTSLYRNTLTNNNENTITDTSTVDSTTFRKIRNRMSSKYGRMRKRVVFKNGDCNLHQTNISKRRRKYLADIFVTLVDLQWRWTFLIFTMSFLLSWTFFAIIYWSISLSHGDLEVENLPQNQETSGWSPCIANFWGFTSSFLYSLETQSTIGYGFRYTTTECPDAIFVMCVQTILGVIIQAVMVGVVFSKISRPKKRTQTLMFSKYAVICQRDGSLCLMLRVGDMRKSHIICASVRAQLIKRRSTMEGEVLPFYQHELKVGVDSDQQAIFFIWPMVVVHQIDKDSPLYTISAADLAREKFEIVVILEGVIESTGATTQARTSYLPSEILWGHRFEPLVSFKKELGEYSVDYSLFNSFYEVDTPLCSGEELDELQAVEQDLKREGLNQLLTPFRVAVVDEKRQAGRRQSAAAASSKMD